MADSNQSLNQELASAIIYNKLMFFTSSDIKQLSLKRDFMQVCMTMLNCIHLTMYLSVWMFVFILIHSESSILLIYLTDQPLVFVLLLLFPAVLLIVCLHLFG